jgi:hypothetical protein
MRLEKWKVLGKFTILPASPKVLIIGDFSRKSPFLFLGFLAYVFFF